VASTALLSYATLSARVPECQKIKKGRLDQYGPEHSEVQPFDTTGLDRVNSVKTFKYHMEYIYFITWNSTVPVAKQYYILVITAAVFMTLDFYASIAIGTVLEVLCYWVVYARVGPSVLASQKFVYLIFYKPLCRISPYLQFWCTWGQRHLSRFWGQKVKGQGHNRLNVVKKGRRICISDSTLSFI